MVRKNKYSKDWYLESMTNEWAGDFDIEHIFPDQRQEYTAEIYRMQAIEFCLNLHRVEGK